MENIEPTTVWAVVLAIALAITTLANAAEKIGQAIKAAKAPNAKQDERLDKLERRLDEVDRKLANDNSHLTDIDQDNRLTQRALIALLDHGLDGNNVKQMQDAKEALLNHLTDK